METPCESISQFWDHQLSWNTTFPQFTRCFENTVLTFIPSVFQWLFLPCKILSIRKSKSRLLPWTILNVTKLVLCLLLSVLFIVKLCIPFGKFENISQLYIIGCIYQAVTFFLSALCIYFDRKFGVRSSFYMLCHWLLLTIAGMFSSVDYSNSFAEILATKGETDFIIFCIYYPLVLAQLFLSILTDAKPIYSTQTHFKSSQKRCSYETASLISRLIFAWHDRLLWNGFKKELKSEDISEAIPAVKTHQTVPKCMKIISTSLQNNKTLSCGWIIWKTHRRQMIQIVLIFVLADACIYVNPFILKHFFRFIASDDPHWHGYVYVFSLFVMYVAHSILSWQGIFSNHMLACAIRSSFTSLIYRKCLTLSCSVRQKTTTGEMINLISVDLLRVVQFVDDSLYAVMFPIQLTAGFYLLYNLVGASAFAGFVAMVPLILTSLCLAKRQEVLETRQLKIKDERIKNLSEAISGIKVLKFFTWENNFMDRIGRLRQKETRSIRNCLLIEGASNLIWIFLPFVMSMAVFGTYIFQNPDNVLDVEKIFVTIAIIGILQMPMFLLPITIAGFIQARVSVNRINKYLNGKDMDEDAVTRTYNRSLNAIRVTDADFEWSSEDPPNKSSNFKLQNVNLKIGRGSLIAVVGTVGCGKSSLLAALLGEMEKKRGSACVDGKIAYVAQQAWIQNATLKANILFGKPLDETRYREIIRCCDLEPDLAIIPGGDEAEIGEKGINLSGGQRQRISLARAVYHDADVYLLDDPLSAVDPEVGSHIFNNVIGPQGMLKEKTRVLVTHSLTYLPFVNNIIVLTNGKISETGTYNELLEHNKEFAQFLRTYRIEKCDSVPNFVRSEVVKSKDFEMGNGNLTTKEHMEQGHVKSSVYRSYLAYIGFPMVSLAVIFVFIAYGFSGCAEVWLSRWSMDAKRIEYQLANNQSSAAREQNSMRLGVYGALVFCNGLFYGLFVLTFVYGSMNACVSFHEKLLKGVLRSPMSFFDTTPSGRIVNRFSKDIDTVDSELPHNFISILSASMHIFEAFFVICVKIPVFIAVIVPLFALYYLTQIFFIRTIDQLRRLESVTRSPIYSKFSETAAGTSTLRAFKKENEFIGIFNEQIDENMKHIFNVKILFCWVGVRLDFVGNLFIVLTALFGFLQASNLDAGTVALIVNYSCLIRYAYMWLVVNAGTLESNIVSVERLNEYILLPSEASWETENKELDLNWPNKGEIVFRNYSTKYRPELPTVVKKVNLKINAGEKIGVIGRTGAGKSSVALALFRMMEATEGDVTIDNVDISGIGLHDLRSRLTIIPQDPVLFSGPLRFNLDPYDRYSDEQLWKVLELAHLKDFVSTFSSGLNQEVAEGGSNLSVGQKQLLCLARALLKKTKILVLDEATAAVDSETDALIQSTIRTEFNHCTILTIAHRLNTIMDCARLIVLDEGKIKAFDKPSKLLETIKSSIDLDSK